MKIDFFYVIIPWRWFLTRNPFRAGTRWIISTLIIRIPDSQRNHYSISFRVRFSVVAIRNSFSDTLGIVKMPAAFARRGQTFAIVSASIFPMVSISNILENGEQFSIIDDTLNILWWSQMMRDSPLRTFLTFWTLMTNHRLDILQETCEQIPVFLSHESARPNSRLSPDFGLHKQGVSWIHCDVHHSQAIEEICRNVSRTSFWFIWEWNENTSDYIIFNSW
jgi:hypothetical protein